MKFFNLVFLLKTFKIFIRRLFFSIIHRFETLTSFLFVILHKFEKTRNIRDIMNNVFINNVFDLKIDDFNIITQVENA